MTNPTTPFSWQMPTASDLVTDLPADFETFGQAVATSMADLLGGTTGQILSKASNTDMDFTWTTANPGDITAVTAGTGISGGGTSGAVTITNSMATEIAAKGDLIAGTGSQTFDNISVGTNGQVLTADSTTATGLKWASSSAPSYTWTNYTPTVTASSGTITSTTSKGQYLQIGKMIVVSVDVLITNAGTGSGNLNVSLPINALPGNVNRWSGSGAETAATGKGLQVVCDAGNVPTLLTSRFYDFTTCIATNNRLDITIIYEVA